jgi:hypothetical protein
MILKVYSRIFTEFLDKSLQVLQPLIHEEVGFRVKFKDMEVAVLGDFCFLAGPESSMKPFLGAVGPRTSTSELSVETTSCLGKP